MTTEETVDKGWLSGLYWKQKHDELLQQYQELINKHEEFKREVSAGYRNNNVARPYLLGGDKES